MKQLFSHKRPSWEAIGAIAGVIGVIIAFLALKQPETSHNNEQPQTSQSAGQETQTTSSSNSNDGEQPKWKFKDIILAEHAAADLDSENPQITPGMNGLTGNNDLYHYSTPVSANFLYVPDALYSYTENQALAYTKCTNYLADTTQTFYDYTTFDIGKTFCFYTSEGRLALVEMTALEGSPGNYTSVTLNASVWEAKR